MRDGDAFIRRFFSGRYFLRVTNMSASPLRNAASCPEKALRLSTAFSANSCANSRLRSSPMSEGYVVLPISASLPAGFPSVAVSAVSSEDVVDDLEGDAERFAVGAQAGRYRVPRLRRGGRR